MPRFENAEEKLEWERNIGRKGCGSYGTKGSAEGYGEYLSSRKHNSNWPRCSSPATSPSTGTSYVEIGLVCVLISWGIKSGLGWLGVDAESAHKIALWGFPVIVWFITTSLNKGS